jgi:hypothetical protein
MQQNESTEKFVQFWNDQALDTHHDIIISVDYSLINIDDTPSCGFCIALFESINGKPRGGGIRYSLAYTPSESRTCEEPTLKGLEAAVYGIGFDINGIFAKRTPYVQGVEHTTANSICLRDGIRNDYKVLKQTENLQYSKDFTISQQLTSTQEEIFYKQARVVFSKCMSHLRVQVKKENEKEFITVLETNLPLYDKKSVKVGLFYTSLDQHSRFNVKQFNVAGFPAKKEEKINTVCVQDINTEANLKGNRLPSNGKWIASSQEKGFNIYKYNGKDFVKSQQFRSTNPLKILNYHENLIFTKSENKLLIYEFLGNKVIRQNTISLPLSGDEITSCAGYGDTLVIASSSTGENHHVYNYVTESSVLSTIGTWRFYQTFNSTVTGLGTNIEMSENYLLSYSTDDKIVSFKKDPDFGYQYHQTINPPYSGAKGFGYSMSIQNDNEMIVGAPFGEKRYIYGNNQGEAFHYVLSPVSKEWILISEMGQYFNMDTLSGAFGYSVKISGKRAAISAPFETFYLDDYPLLEVANQGKVYLLEKDQFGYFTNRTIYYPTSVSLLDGERNYGTQVNIFGDILAVGVPFSESVENDFIEIYNLYCPPLSAPLLRPTPTATSVATPTPTPTVTVTPTVTPTIGTSPTPTPSITPTNIVLGAGIVTLINGVQITEIDGADIYPLKGIVTFEDYQVQGFDGENVNPF